MRADSHSKTATSWRSWWRSGSAWGWYSLFALSVSALLVLALLLLIVFSSAQYFWPQPLEEWVIRSMAPGVIADPAADNVNGNGKSQRLFAYPGARLQLPAVTVMPADDAMPSSQATRKARWIRYQALPPQPGVQAVDMPGKPVWQQQAVAEDAIIRRGRPRSLAQVILADGSRVAGYPLLWVRTAADSAPMVAPTAASVLDAADPVEQSALLPDSERRLLQLDRIRQQWQQLKTATKSGWSMVLELHDGSSIQLAAGAIEQVLLPNALSLQQAARQAVSNAWQFISHAPDAAVPGILPAILGTLLLVVLMSLLLVPVALLTAVYLHEYAPQNRVTGLMRAVISNLAGVPGVVYGVFVLGVFVHGVGGGIDALLYAEQMPSPSFAGGGLLWAAFALALLTMPVVIVATEEGLSRIPVDFRRAALALGATSSEMIWRVVVPAAYPALLTGWILAIARAAGEVAPLLLLGAVTSTRQPSLDGQAPLLHLQEPFMHLGYQVYDFALQPGQPDNATAMAYATTLVLILLVLVLNLFAFRLRASLRNRYRAVA